MSLPLEPNITVNCLVSRRDRRDSSCRFALERSSANTDGLRRRLHCFLATPAATHPSIHPFAVTDYPAIGVAEGRSCTSPQFITGLTHKDERA